jgi:hypothetical protein
MKNTIREEYNMTKTLIVIIAWTIVLINEVSKTREKRWSIKEKKQGYRVLKDGTIEIL